MSKILFSDVHIGHPDFINAHIFNQFLNFECTKYDEVIIVGDLFELWFNNKEDIYTSYPYLINSLDNLKKITKVTYIPGNHDYLHKNIYISSQLIYPIYQFKINDKLFSVTHGHNQSLESQVKLYSLYRILMDMQIFQKIFYKIFSIEKFYLIEYLYKKYTAYRSNDIIEQLENSAKKMNGFVIMGHSHYMTLKENYANTGCWIDNTNYLTIDDNGVVKSHVYANTK